MKTRYLTYAMFGLVEGDVFQKATSNIRASWPSRNDLDMMLPAFANTSAFASWLQA